MLVMAQSSSKTTKHGWVDAMCLLIISIPWSTIQDDIPNQIISSCAKASVDIEGTVCRVRICCQEKGGVCDLFGFPKSSQGYGVKGLRTGVGSHGLDRL